MSRTQTFDVPFELDEQQRGDGWVARLEARLAWHYEMDYALCVSSATTGLLGVAMAAGLAGEEFVTTPYTYGGSIDPWMLIGSRPVFTGVNPETLCLDPHRVLNVLSKRTRAILAVDLFGAPCDAQALRKVADEAGVPLVVDAAQSFGSSVDGQAASRHAHAVVLSFGAGKALSAGEGGAVLTNSRDLYEKLLWHTQHPDRQSAELGFGVVNEFGLNGRLHPWTAWYLVQRFDELLEAVRCRQRLCLEAIDRLATAELVDPLPSHPSQTRSSYFRLPIIARPGVEPDDCLRTLTGLRFGRERCPRPLYRHAAFRAWEGCCPSRSATVRLPRGLIVLCPPQMFSPMKTQKWRKVITPLALFQRAQTNDSPRSPRGSTGRVLGL